METFPSRITAIQREAPYTGGLMLGGKEFKARGHIGLHYM
jgi:hypothetical protein